MTCISQKYFYKNLRQRQVAASRFEGKCTTQHTEILRVLPSPFLVIQFFFLNYFDCAPSTSCRTVGFSPRSLFVFGATKQSIFTNITTGFHFNNRVFLLPEPFIGHVSPRKLVTLHMAASTDFLCKNLISRHRSTQIMPVSR